MIPCWKQATAAASMMLLVSTLVGLCPAFVLVHPVGVVPQTQVVYHSHNGQPLVPVGAPGQPPVIYHYGPGGVSPELQPPVVLVRVVPVLPPPNQPPLQPPFIEEVPPVFKNPPPDPEDTPPAKKPRPSKRGRDSQTRKSRRPPAESTTKRPPNKLNRRVNPKSERLTNERLTLAKNA
ncbi:hypothetical protein MTO96_022511 [Rhipicephalus appendiculatus]